MSTYNQILIDGDWVNGEPSIDGQKYRIVHDFGNGSVGYVESFWSIGEDKATIERQWRDSELQRTDALIVLPDYPYSDALLAYRKALRDYPEQPDFPDGTRPLQ